MTTAAITILSSGIVIFFLCQPLIRRKVPMNDMYGFRIPAAYESEQRWFDINAYGGRCVAVGTVPIMLVGVAGFFIAPEHKDVYAITGVAVTMVSIFTPVLMTFRWCRKKE